MALPEIRAHEVHYTGSGWHPSVYVAFPLPPTYRDEYFPAAMAVAVAAKECRRDRAGMCWTRQIGGPRAPVAVIQLFSPESKGVADDLARMWKAVDRAIHEPDARIFDSVNNQLARTLMNEFDSLPLRAEGFAEGLQFRPDRHPFAQSLIAIDKASPKRVREAAATYLTRDRAVVVVFEKQRGEEPALPRRGGGSAAGLQHEGDEWKAAVAPGEAERPLEVPIPRLAIEDAEQLVLANGLRVVLSPTSGAPVVSAQLVFAGGSAADPAGKPGLAWEAANRLEFSMRLAAGAGKTGVNEALYRFGDRIDADVGVEYTRFKVEGLASHLDAMLAGLGARLGEGHYPDRGAKTACGSKACRSKSSRKRREEDPAVAWLRAWGRFEREMREAVFGAGHAYAAWIDFGAARFGTSDLEAFRRDYYGASNGVLIVTGSFDPELAKEQVRHWFGGLPKGASQWITRSPLPSTPQTRWIVVDSGDDAPMTEIRLAVGTDADSASTGARMVLAEMLQQRVWTVRQKLGAAYAVSATYQDNIGPGALLAFAQVDSSRVTEAMAAIDAALSGLRGSGDSELAGDFVRARRRVLDRLLSDGGGARARAAMLANLAERGQGLGHYTELARSVADLTLADMRTVIGRDLAPERMVIGVFGPKASLDAVRGKRGEEGAENSEAPADEPEPLGR